VQALSGPAIDTKCSISSPLRHRGGAAINENLAHCGQNRQSGLGPWLLNRPSEKNEPHKPGESRYEPGLAGEF